MLYNKHKQFASPPRSLLQSTFITAPPSIPKRSIQESQDLFSFPSFCEHNKDLFLPILSEKGLRQQRPRKRLKPRRSMNSESCSIIPLFLTSTETALRPRMNFIPISTIIIKNKTAMTTPARMPQKNEKLGERNVQQKPIAKSLSKNNSEPSPLLTKALLFSPNNLQELGIISGSLQCATKIMKRSKSMINVNKITPEPAMKCENKNVQRQSFFTRSKSSKDLQLSSRSMKASLSSNSLLGLCDNLCVECTKMLKRSKSITSLLTM